MITKEEFLKRLKEDKFHTDPQDHIDYRLPVVQYYLTNHTGAISINGESIVSSRFVTIEYHPLDFVLVNQAFDSIKKQFIK